jgi:hypothetical protein
MINRTILNSSFVQYGDTCILGSYAIVSNFYTEIPFLDFFKDFCKDFDIGTEENDFKKYFSEYFNSQHPDYTQRITRWFNLTELNKYELAYDYSFHRECSSRNVNGLNLMKEIHEISKQNSFESSRNSFSLSYIPVVKNDIVNVIECLACEESLLMIAFQGERGGRHISVVGYDNNGFYMIETRPNKTNGAVSISHIPSLPDVGDALLAIQINDNEEKGS